MSLLDSIKIVLFFILVYKLCFVFMMFGIIIGVGLIIIVVVIG